MSPQTAYIEEKPFLVPLPEAVNGGAKARINGEVVKY